MRKIVFLDQNKWIDLARAGANPHANEEHHEVFKNILRACKDQKIIIPLTFANIYETQKINDPLRRQRLANLQSMLSAGHVFQSGAYRRQVELKTFFDSKRRGHEVLNSQEWFLSSNFFDAFAKREQHELQSASASNYRDLVKLMAVNPSYALYCYMADLSDDARRYAVEKFSEGSQKLIANMSKRVRRVAIEPISMRRKVYRAICFMEFQDEINAAAAEHKLYQDSLFTDYGKLVREVLCQLPCFAVETEIALKIDMKIQSVTENHLRDLGNVCAAIPYADIAVFEKEFAGIIEQTQLNKKFKTEVFTDIIQFSKNL
jgi:hypothetical protein